jgi:tellurite resistance protein TerC
MENTIAQGWMWAGFVIFVIAMLAIDMLALGGSKPRKVGVKEAAYWSLGWFSLAMVFNFLLWWYVDGSVGREVANTKAMEFFTGYLIEKSLSVDNLFVFLTIFSYFAVPPEYQRRVLMYGVLGAIVLRAIMILGGIWLVQHFSWMLYVFGVFLIVTGIKNPTSVKTPF